MPRTGDVYSVPAGTDAVSNATISSTAYNAFLRDIETWVGNGTRPVSMGGTGGSTPAAARDNLGAEVAASQQTVDNYDSHVWKSGSFASNPGAAGAPDAAAYYFGTVVAAADNNSVTVQARNMSTGITYTRRKLGGAWQGTAPYWTNDSGSDKLPLAGGTLTGALAMSYASPQFTLVKGTAAADQVMIAGARNNVMRWGIVLGQGTTEPGDGSGSDFLLLRYNDGGGYLGAPIVVSRLNGAVTLANNLSVAGTINGTSGGLFLSGYGGTANAGVVFLGGSNNRYLHHTGTQYEMPGAELIVNGTQVARHGTAASFASLSTSSVINAGGAITSTFGVVASNSASFPKFVCQQSGTDRAQFYYDTNTGQVTIHNMAYSQTIELMTNGYVRLGTGLNCRAGASGVYGSSCVNFNWTGAVACWVDTTNMGNISFTSDYRVKKDVAELGSTWEAVRALRPVSYTQTDYTPAGSDTPLFAADDTERWGFLAHELQETLLPSAATGVKDDPVNVQSPNPWVVIAALTKTIQEMQARIEALEERALEAGL